MKTENREDNPSKIEKTAKTRLFEDAIAFADQVNNKSAPYLAGELFKSMAGVNITMVPYKGGGPALNGLIGGETNLIPNAGAVMPHRRIRPRPSSKR